MLRHLLFFAIAGCAYTQPKWDALAAHQPPEWLTDAKFGIYAHWGGYSVPAFGNEWYGKEMYDPAGRRGIYQHQLRTYGTLDRFGYKDFVPLFKAEKFDAAEWGRSATSMANSCKPSAPRA